MNQGTSFVHKLVLDNIRHKIVHSIIKMKSQRFAIV